MFLIKWLTFCLCRFSFPTDTQLFVRAILGHWKILNLESDPFLWAEMLLFCDWFLHFADLVLSTDIPHGGFNNLRSAHLTGLNPWGISKHRLVNSNKCLNVYLCNSFWMDINLWRKSPEDWKRELWKMTDEGTDFFAGNYVWLCHWWNIFCFYLVTSLYNVEGFFLLNPAITQFLYIHVFLLTLLPKPVHFSSSNETSHAYHIIKLFVNNPNIPILMCEMHKKKTYLWPTEPTT